jgi:alpha-beta hydrolase superfamily lysophospholipase
MGVVLCNPFGYEAMSIHRTYRHLAERLAAAGYPALRFDYDGTGDSAGQFGDPGRVRAALASIKAAIALMRARAGVRRIALFGVRLGASLATLAALADGDVEALVSWAPIVSGRAHVRELRAYRMLKDSKTPKAPRADGGEEVGGYLYTADTLAELSAIDLLALEGRIASRVLVLPRTENSREEGRLTEHLKLRGSEAQLLPTGEFPRMMRDDPYESVVPSETLDSVREWLAHVAGSASGRALAGPSARWAPAPSSIAVQSPDGRSALKETAHLFGRGDRLFGVVTEPEGPVKRDRPAFCFLNVGGNHHVGPHRMNVELGRELAARGYLSFRFDTAGLGESPATPGERENRIYTMDAVADVQSAMTMLHEQHGAKRFVLVGLCSGAYVAYYSGIADPRVVGQVLLSPFAFEWKEGDPVAPTMRKPFRSTRFYARSLLDPQVWSRAARGDVELRAIAGALLERFKTRFDLMLPAVGSWLRGRLQPQNAVERAFAAMSDRGVESLMVLSFDDGGLDMIAAYLGADASRMRGRKNFDFRVIDDADHTFTTLSAQETLRTLLTDYAATRFP